MSCSFEFIGCKVSTEVVLVGGCEFKSSYKVILTLKIGANEKEVACQGLILFHVISDTYRRALDDFPKIKRYQVYSSNRGASRGDGIERFYATFINPNDGRGGKDDQATFEGWGGDDIRNMIQALTKGFRWVIDQ